MLDVGARDTFMRPIIPYGGMLYLDYEVPDWVIMTSVDPFFVGLFLVKHFPNRGFSEEFIHLMDSPFGWIGESCRSR